MTDYIIFSDWSSTSKLAEELAKKLRIKFRRIHYGSNMGRGGLGIQTPTYPMLTNSIESFHGWDTIVKLEEMLVSRKYLMNWLILENKTSLLLARLIAENY